MGQPQAESGVEPRFGAGAQLNRAKVLRARGRGLGEQERHKNPAVKVQAAEVRHDVGDGRGNDRRPPKIPVHVYLRLCPESKSRLNGLEAATET